MDPNLLVDQLGSAAVVVFLLEWLKKQSWFIWLTDESTKRVKWLFSLVFGALAVAGIGYVWTPSEGTLLVTGLTLTGIATALWHYIVQIVSQKVIYRVAVQTPEATKTPAAVLLRRPGA
jgi:hypothetical protein